MRTTFRSIFILLIVLSICACTAKTPEPKSEAIQPAAPSMIKRYKIGFLAGSVDPFYAEMERDANKAAETLGVDLVFQIPKVWDPVVQTEMLDALIARGDLDLLIIVPVDTNAMIEPMKRAYDAGLPLITVDAPLDDGDYTEGPDSFVLSYIGSDNYIGGWTSGQEMDHILGGKGKVYIQNYDPGYEPTMLRENGFRDYITQNTSIEIVGSDYNLAEPERAEQQTSAILQKERDLTGIFTTDCYATEGASLALKNAGLENQVVIIGMDQPTPVTREQLEKGVLGSMIAQRPGEMAYYGIMFGIAYLDGQDDIPKMVRTKWTAITTEDLKDPIVLEKFKE
jgi:ribose transport system substrate-binding protein